MNTIDFDADKPLGMELSEWWQDLQNHRSDRAELRRAKTVADIVLLPVFHRARMRFKPFFENQTGWEYRLAAIIGLLSHVTQTNQKKIALQMAGKPKPVVSELRFRRLIQRDREDLYVSMIRVINMLGKTANLHDLARSIYYWGDKIKRDWAFEYFPNT